MPDFFDSMDAEEATKAFYDDYVPPKDIQLILDTIQSSAKDGCNKCKVSMERKINEQEVFFFEYLGYQIDVDSDDAVSIWW